VRLTAFLSGPLIGSWNRRLKSVSERPKPIRLEEMIIPLEDRHPELRPAMVHRRRVEIKFPKDITPEEKITLIERLGWIDTWIPFGKDQAVITQGDPDPRPEIFRAHG
jgi:hypothetical protein